MIPILLLLISLIFTSTGQTILKIGSQKFNTANFIEAYIQNPYFYIGISCYAVSAIIWFYVLSKFNLSYAYSMVSLNFVFITITSHFILHEKINSLHLISIGIIISGIICLNYAQK